jgi:hypothetical protein
MMRIRFILLLFCLNKFADAQIIHEHYIKSRDSLRIGSGKGDFLPYDKKGYTLILPDSIKNLSGILVSLDDRKFNRGDSAQQIYPQANAQGYGVLYVSTGVPVDLFMSKRSLVYIDTLLKSLFDRYDLPEKNIFFLGVNLSGYRALKYIQYRNQNKAAFRGTVGGVILCDGVLDWVRQWYEAKKGVKDNFAESSVFEGKLITYLLEKHLGGTPRTKLESYLEFSAYSYFDERNRHLKYLENMAVRAYSEPATIYWMEEKGKTTFDTNFPDMAGIINELKLAGNNDAELTLFHQDPKLKDRRNPNYTWGLVDKTELMNWIISKAKNN